MIVFLCKEVLQIVYFRSSLVCFDPLAKAGLLCHVIVDLAQFGLQVFDDRIELFAKLRGKAPASISIA